jgi:hypothetical protein
MREDGDLLINTNLVVSCIWSRMFRLITGVHHILRLPHTETERQRKRERERERERYIYKLYTNGDRKREMGSE